MQVVVAARDSRLTIEGNHNTLADIFGEVDSYGLAICGVGNIVIDIFRTGIVPLAENCPSGAVVGAHKHYKLVVGLTAGSGAVTAAIFRQGKVEGKLGGLHAGQRDGGSDQPTLVVTIDIASGMVVENIVAGAKAPSIGVCR